LAADNLARLQARLDTRGEGYPLLVYNPASCRRSGLIRAPYPPGAAGAPPTAWALLGPDGQRVPARFGSDGVAFRTSLPALGYRLLRMVSSADLPPATGHLPSPATFDGGVLRDGGYVLAFDPATGDLTGIAESHTGRQLLAGPSNRLVLYEEAEKSTSWVQAFTGRTVPLELTEPPRVVESDPFRTVVSTTSRTRFSSFTRQVWIAEGRIEGRLAVDWRERDVFLKLGFAPRVRSARVTAGIAHGQVAVENPEREFCVHEWVDVGDETWGLGVVTDGVYGADLRDGVLGLSVLRTARDMDASMGHGVHELHYALCPHLGPLRPSELLAEAHRLLRPLQWAWDSAHGGAFVSWGRIDTSQALAPEGSFLSVDATNVEVAALKMPEEHYTPDALVVRLREVDGRATRCRVDLPVPCVALHRSDHLERPLEPMPGEQGRRVQVSLRPYELVTYIAYL
jgi:alpha-mannosidase